MSSQCDLSVNRLVGFIGECSWLTKSLSGVVCMCWQLLQSTSIIELSVWRVLYSPMSSVLSLAAFVYFVLTCAPTECIRCEVFYRGAIYRLVSGMATYRWWGFYNFELLPLTALFCMRLWANGLVLVRIHVPADISTCTVKLRMAH